MGQSARNLCCKAVDLRFLSKLCATCLVCEFVILCDYVKDDTEVLFYQNKLSNQILTKSLKILLMECNALW